MKNKYIESMFDSLEDKVLLLTYPPKYPKEIIKEYIEQLERELEMKDKALDKAIKKITLDKDEGTQFLDSQYEYWKEWCLKMSNLTKERCEQALNDIKFLGSINIPLSSIVVTDNLINEHFDNPPLEFEGLCEDEPVFDKVSNCWRYVLQKDYDKEGFYDSINDEWIDFEKDRFYAKEVKDDE